MHVLMTPSDHVSERNRGGRQYEMPSKHALIMHPDDNMATAVEEIQAGSESRNVSC